MIKTLKPYRVLIISIVLLSTFANILSLYFPKKIGEYIDTYNTGTTSLSSFLWVLGGLSLLILLITVIQFWVAVYTSEKVAFDLRNTLIGSLKKRSFSYMREMSGGKLITILTSDVDAVKNLIVSGIASILMASVTLIGVVISLVLIDWKMALLTLSVIPFIFIVFGVVFKKIGPLFEATQINLDSINKVINESIVASPVIRILNAKYEELKKFDVVNKKGTEIAMKLVVFFSALIPIITLLSQAAILIVLWFGGQKVALGQLTLGEMSAFFSYTSVLIWPFFVLSFAGTFISKAQISLKRINEILENTQDIVHSKDSRPLNSDISLQGHIIFKNVTVIYGEKTILNNISFEIKPHTRTAIIGPTGAGKTELLYVLAGLVEISSGEISIDGIPLKEWDQQVLFSKMSFVFQDSILFNTTLKENILFKNDINDNHQNERLQQALEVSELAGLVQELPDGVETNISERGINLSGGQKQRVMLARAIAMNPSVLLFDDFTSRVDAVTEQRILENLSHSFSQLTLISITQKIEPIKKYDHIIVLMEGELIAQGNHDTLLRDSLEYRQIHESQQSTENHE